MGSGESKLPLEYFWGFLKIASVSFRERPVGQAVLGAQWLMIGVVLSPPLFHFRGSRNAQSFSPVGFRRRFKRRFN